MTSITSVTSDAGPNTFCFGGYVEIVGTGFGTSSGSVVILDDHHVKTYTSFASWVDTKIKLNPSLWTPYSNRASLIVITSSGNSSIFEVSLYRVDNSLDECLHGFGVNNFVTVDDTTSTYRYNDPAYGSLGVITSVSPINVHFSRPPYDWSPEIEINQINLTRLGEPIKTMLQKQGVWNVLQGGRV
jgi:hypothetical protein